MKSLAFITVVMWLVTACSAEKTAPEYLEAAQLHRKSGELQAALIEGRNAIRLDSSNSEARALIGELEFLVGSPVNSEKELLQAIELGSSEVDLRQLLSKVYLSLGKHEELMSLELTMLPPDSKAEILTNQGASSLSLGQILKARDFAQEALILDPDSPNALTLKARILAIEGDLAQSREVLVQVLDNSETQSDAWELLGDIESSENKLDEAAIAYTKAAEYTLKNLPAILKRARINLQLNEYAKVREDLDRVRSSGARLPIISLMNSEMLFSEGKFLDAQTELEAGLKLSPDSPTLARSLALTHLMLGNLGQAEQYGKQYQTSVNSVDSLALQAAIRLQQERADQAEQTLQPLVDAKQLNLMSARILATALLKQGKWDEAITTMIDLHDKMNLGNTQQDLAVLDLPSVVLAQELLNFTPQVDAERKEFLNPDSLLIESAISHLASGQTGEATAEVNKLVARSPEHPAINDLFGRIALKNEDSDAARTYFETLGNSGEPSASAVLFLSKLDFDSEDPESAKTRLINSLSHTEGMMRERILITIANIEGFMGNDTDMIRWLKQAKSENESAYIPTVALANYYLQIGQPQEAVNTISSLTPIGKSNPQSIKLMAQAHLALKQYEEAKDLLTPFVSQTPDDPELRYLRAGASAGLGDTASLTSDLEAALRSNPEHAPSLLAKTNLDIQADRLDMAGLQLARLENLVPGEPSLVAISERLNERKKSNATEGSMPVLENTDDVIQAAKTLWSEGKQGEALSIMTGWVDENPEDIVILLTLGNTYISLEKRTESITMFESVLAVEPTNFIALNNLAWQLRDEDPTKAISHASTALLQQPDNVAMLDTLAVIHYGQGSYGEAEEAFRKIQALQTTDPTILFHGARIEVALGNMQAAKDLLQPLVDGSVEFAEAAEAKALLDSL